MVDGSFQHFSFSIFVLIEGLFRAVVEGNIRSIWAVVIPFPHLPLRIGIFVFVVVSTIIVFYIRVPLCIHTSIYHFFWHDSEMMW